MKQIPLGYPSSAVKASKTFDVSKSGITTEFTTARLRIRRIVSAQGEASVNSRDQQQLGRPVFESYKLGSPLSGRGTGLEDRYRGRDGSGKLRPHEPHYNVRLRHHCRAGKHSRW